MGVKVPTENTVISRFLPASSILKSYFDEQDWICLARLFRFAYFRIAFDDSAFFPGGAAGSRR
jgi:hypothetical protein